MGGSGIGTTALRDMMNHPNFKMPVPEEEESPIDFSVRCIAHLISPEQVHGESNDIECIELKEAIKKFKVCINDAWSEYYQLKHI